MKAEIRENISDVVLNELPEEAQEIYLEAYEEAWEDYEESMGGEMGQASVAHRNAMYIVKTEFEKDDEKGIWYRKGEKPIEDEEDEDEGLLSSLEDAL
jgi:cation transport regulator